MRTALIALALTAAACSPPAAPPAPEAPAMTAETPPLAPTLELGPYTNSWDSAEFSRYRHTLNAPAAGAHRLTLQAQTDASGGETVAVYPVGPDGERRTARILFVVADGDGSSVAQSVEIPAEGLPVEGVIENAGGRRHVGSYTLTVE